MFFNLSLQEKRRLKQDHYCALLFTIIHDCVVNISGNTFISSLPQPSNKCDQCHENTLMWR